LAALSADGASYGKRTEAKTMARNIYTVTVSHVAVTLAKNLLTLTAPTGKQLQILQAEFTNANNETNEQLTCAIYAVSAAGTGTPTYVVPQPVWIGGTAASTNMAAHTYATTEPTLASLPIFSQASASLSGWLYAPAARATIKLPPAAAATFRITDSTYTALTVSLLVTFAEMNSGETWF
jgi:hypothetical protein